MSGVDGQGYCRVHAKKLERDLDAWARDIADFERFAAAPAWLPSGLHAEWRVAYRDLIHPQGGNPDANTLIEIAAAGRIYKIERAHGGG